MAIKKISIQSLRVGMYYAGCDLPWISTPFWRRRFLIRSVAAIERLRRYGALEVQIDTVRGSDVAAASQPSPVVDKTRPAPSPAESAAAKELATARKARQELLDSVQSVFEHVASGVLSAEETRHIAHRTVATTLSQPSAFLALSRTRKFDPTLQEHALSVCTLAVFVGHALKCGPGRLEDLAHGALLHDVGLVRLPHYMVRLSRRLSGHEQELYDSHPRLGAELLQKEGGFHRDIVEIVAEHHTTLDQRPTRSTAYRRPSEAAQVVGIVDRYVELTSSQVDSPGLPGDRALSQLYQEAQAGLYDLALVSQFVQVVGIYPLYSLVELNTGERAIVTQMSPGHLHRPVVTVVRDADGRRSPTPVRIDLSAERGPDARTIVSVLDGDPEGVPIEELLPGVLPEHIPA